jgi:hypothetical protein
MTIQPAFASGTYALFRGVFAVSLALFLWGGLVSSSFGLSPSAGGTSGDFEARAEWAGNVAAAAAPAAVVPVITVQPLEGKVAAGFPAIFSVGVAGGGALGYQWRKNGVAIAGGTSATFRIDSAQKGDEILSPSFGYDVVVSGVAGSVTSARVALAVVEGGAYLIENPSGSSVKLGRSYTLRVTSADPEVTYQWRKNGVAIAGAKGSSHTLSAFKDTDAGRYDVVVRNSFGDVVSGPAYMGLASKVVPNFQTAVYQWTTLAGNGLSGSANGTGLAAQFNAPSSIALHEGGTLYVSDTNNHVIRKVTQAGVVSTVAGLSGTPGSADGAALSVARFDSPQGIAVDKSGAVYIADQFNNTVRKLTNPGQFGATVTTVAGVAGDFDTPGGLNSPSKVALDPSGSLYVLDNSTIRKVVSKTQFTLLFGELPEAYTGTQPWPMAMTVDSGGKILAAAIVDGDFKVFARPVGGSFAATNYGPYLFSITDLAAGAGNNLYAATEGTVELLGDLSQTRPGAGLPANLTSPVNGYAAPRALTVDEEGAVYAVDPFLNTVIKGVPSGLPVFVLQPAGATGKEGVALTLSAFAEGSGTIAYQWYRDGIAIAGATEAAYTMASGGSGAGDYLVEASNSAGTVSSAVAKVLGTIIPLEILSQPQAKTVASGAAVALEVGWRGPASTTFKWYKNGVAVTGATSAVLSLPTANVSDAGDYKVELRSGTVLKTSVVVKLTVSLPASIFSQPENVAVAAGNPASLRVSATGTQPLTYQWFRNGVAVEGGTASVYHMPQASGLDSGVYTVAVSSVAGDPAISDPATVSILVPPSVIVQPLGPLAVKRGGAATFTVSAAGSEPMVYQWRKDGVPVAGGTAATLTVENVQEEQAGFYNVTVSNALGSVTSRAAKMSVSLPAAIVSQPPPTVNATVGRPVLLRVVVAGTGPFTYLWQKNGVAVENGTSATYAAPTLEAGSARYLVTVTGAGYGNTVESAGTILTVGEAKRAISILQTPPLETKVIKGSAAFLRLAVDPNPSDAVKTTYKLLTAAGADTKIGGTVPATGELEVPLKTLTASGTYTVAFSRQYTDKTVLSGVATSAFAVQLRTLEKAAGTYELLLADSNGLVGDGASYRGVLLATVTLTGAVSGKILYNEAIPLPGAGASERAYTCVVRTFSTAFTPAAADPDKVVCALNLGAGVQANRQALELELDFSGTAVALNALVRDRVSVAPEVDQEGCVSRGFGAVRGATKLAQVAVGASNLDLSSLVGRYVLGSDFALAQGSGPGQDNNATLLVQVLPTGKVVWASRLSGSTGSGSATLSTTDPTEVTAQIYEGRTLSSTSALSTNSLFGHLLFRRPTNGTPWSASVSSSSGTDQLEGQSCYITKANKVPAYAAARFNRLSVGSASFNWAGVRSLDFQSGTSCLWTGATTAGLLEFLKPAGTLPAAPIPPLYLTAEDPAGEGTYVWTIAVSSAGAVKATNYSATSVQPVLTLRLDKTRGEWAGSYVSPRTKLTRTLAGVLVRPSDGGSLRGAGWVETGAVPATRTGGWRLELTVP